MPDAVIVSTARTPIGRANKGSLVECRPDDLSAFSRGEGPGAIERRLMQAGVADGLSISTRKPDWLRPKVVHGPEVIALKKTVRSHGLVTVCEEAACPNIGECWTKKHATVMILGDTCTRACAFCNVKTGLPGALDAEEPANVGRAVAKLGFKHVVITSVDRDDLLGLRDDLLRDRAWNDHHTVAIAQQVIAGRDLCFFVFMPALEVRDDRVGGEIFVELAVLALMLVGVGRAVLLARDVRPIRRETGVELEPFLEPAFGVGQDRLGRAFGLAHAAIDALVGIDDEHVLAFVEAVDRTHLDAVALALAARAVDDRTPAAGRRAALLARAVGPALTGGLFLFYLTHLEGHYGGPHTDETTSHQIMDSALESGINFFDTANVYGWKTGEGVTEQIIGRYFAQGGGRREKVVLATKVPSAAVVALPVEPGGDRSVGRRGVRVSHVHQAQAGDDVSRFLEIEIALVGPTMPPAWKIPTRSC